MRAVVHKRPIAADRGSVSGRAVLERRTVQIHDALADPEFTRFDTQAVGQFRTLLGVPLLREGTPIGVISLQRRRIEPFTEKQIELVTTFADQAVIAIENARLFEEVQARTAELSEALEQQTATSDVLGVISRSLGQLEPVFQSMLANAMRICDAKCGVMFSHSSDAFRAISCLGVDPSFEQFLREERVWGADTGMGRVARTKQPVHVVDLLADGAYINRDRGRLASVDLGGVRTFLIVPMLKDDELIGAMSIFRQELRPYTEKQIKLVTTFADQAVIAIENARLFEEVQARTAELQESLEYQTATSDVLNLISRAPSQLQPVFDAIVETAARLCDAEYAIVYRLEEGNYHLAATNNADAEYLKYLRDHPIPPARGSVIGRTALEVRTVHLPDCLADPEYTALEFQRSGGFRTVLGVPLLRNGVPVGVIGLLRNVVKPFSEKQIELVETFADQAVIAIENVRLFDEVQARTRELQESLEYQTATSEVLNVISRAPSQLQPVFDAIVETAARLCEADMRLCYTLEGQKISLGRGQQRGKNLSDYAREHPLAPDAARLIGRTALKAAHGPYVRTASPIPMYKVLRIRRRSVDIARCLAFRWCATAQAIGVIALDAQRGEALFRKADRAGRDLRRPGRDRDRERAALRGGPGAYARAY